MAEKIDIEASKNEDFNKLQVAALNKRLKQVYLGGGEKRIAKQHEQGKMTARERIDALLDPKTPRIEIGAFAADGMYTEHGGAPSAGVVVVIGYVSKRQCIVVANDATVKAGAWFPMTGKKYLRAQEIAIENHLPIIYLEDSAGVYLPMQAEIFPDKEHLGRSWRNMQIMDSLRIVQVSAIMGQAGFMASLRPGLWTNAGGAMTSFLAADLLARSAVIEDDASETLGMVMAGLDQDHLGLNVPTDESSILERIRSILEELEAPLSAGFSREKTTAPKSDAKELYGIIPTERTKPYDMREVIARLVDGSEYTEYKEGYGQSIITAYARIDGWAVGIVANQRKVVKSKKGEMQFGGVIYSDSADKATRFIANCNQKNIPLVFLQDVTGFMVGSRSEHGGIIKDGAKLVNAVSNSVVPKFTVIVGNSYGAGNYAMCGKAYDPRLIVGWPSAQVAVMGGEQASKVMLQIEVAALKGRGEEITKEREEEILGKIRSKYEESMSPYYAAARLWLDAIIDPLDTRTWISMGIEAASQAPATRKFNMGVLQT